MLVIDNNCSGEQSIATSSGVHFPSHLVNATSIKEHGFQRHTVGETIATTCASTTSVPISSNDPHSFLTNNIVSRAQLLKQAAIVAWAQLQRPLAQ
jgi:UDP-glucose 4-epimerase